MTRSQFSIISTPPPYALPFTAAMIGFEETDRREILPNPWKDVAMPSDSSFVPPSWLDFQLRKKWMSWMKRDGK